MSKNTKYYEILGVSENATLDHLTKAYKKAALKHHPDKGGDADKFKEMAQAYEALVNDLKRRQTSDQHAEDALKGEKGAGAGTSSRGDGGQNPCGTSKSFHGGRPFQSGGQAGRGSDSSGGASDPKPSNGSESSFHGRSSSGGSKKRGEDMIHPLKVSLEDLYIGKIKKLYVTRTVICTNCNGLVT